MPSIAIIGAGMSGLAAAVVLLARGQTVVIFEKDSDVGGRATTRTSNGFIYDHGAQYIKQGDPTSISFITEHFHTPELLDIPKPVWIFNGQGQIQAGDPQLNAEPKWNYHHGLITLPHLVAGRLNIYLQTPIHHLLHHPGGWTLFTSSGAIPDTFDHVLITIPAPEAIELIQASQLDSTLEFINEEIAAPTTKPVQATHLDPTLQQSIASQLDPTLQQSIITHLAQARYNPLISVTLGYSHPLRTRPYYALVNTDKAHPISWLAWEHEKSPARAPANSGLLIAQMAPQYSQDHWEDTDSTLAHNVAQLVTNLVDEPLLDPSFTDIARWRHALPTAQADAQALNTLTLPSGLSFCGDAFVGGRVHLAIEHGIHIANQILS